MNIRQGKGEGEEKIPGEGERERAGLKKKRGMSFMSLEKKCPFSKLGP